MTTTKELRIELEENEHKILEIRQKRFKCFDNIDIINNYLKNMKKGDLLHLNYSSLGNIECVLLNKRRTHYITVMIKKLNDKEDRKDDILEIPKECIRKINKFITEEDEEYYIKLLLEDTKILKNIEKINDKINLLTDLHILKNL